MPHHEHWYEVLEEPTEVLRQGDILVDLPVYWLADDFDEKLAANENIELRSTTGTWIIASQSCDLDNASGDSPQALVAELRPVTKENLGLGDQKQKDFLAACEVMRRNRSPGAHMVSEFPERGFERHFADLQTLVSLPLGYLRRMALGRVPRLRMRSPFREDFAASVGRHLARVGAEDDQQIPKYARTVFPTKTLRAIEARDDAAPENAGPDA